MPKNSNNRYALPVLMYHHVNPHAKNLVTVTPQEFEAQMAYLAKNGYKTPNAEESLPLLRGEKPLSGKEVLLTFDDGFLDNWVYAYPILRKYGLRAIIFVATGLVEADGPTRPLLGDAQLPVIKEHKDFEYRAVMIDKNFGLYMRWSELAQADTSGVIDIQSHGRFHNENFSGDKITGFNSNSNSRLSLTTQGDSRLGIPIYEKESSLLGRRYNDDVLLRNYLAEYIVTHGNISFFERKKEEWQKELYSVSQDYIDKHGLEGSLESPADCEKRIKEDLTISKQLIEQKLNKKCPTIAWPWGTYNEQLLKWAQAVGYQACFTTERGTNPPGCDMLRLKRCSAKKGVGWLKRQLFIYSRPMISNIYLKFRGKI